MFFTAIFILICIAMLATASIGMECYNNNDAWKNSHKRNHNYLTAAIVLPIIMIVAAGISLYMENSRPYYDRVNYRMRDGRYL
jgi:hypothetical protein